jgi:molecular chaperone GrpE (heat shock protein)
MLSVDTLKLARRYEGAGFQPKQAQDMAAALAETAVESGDNLATKEDVQRLDAKIDNLEIRVNAKIDNLEARVGARISDTKADIIKWMIGQTLAIIGTLAAIIFAVGKSGFQPH